MTRYRTVAQMNPPSDMPAYRYVAIYDLRDIDAALAAFATAGNVTRIRKSSYPHEITLNIFYIIYYCGCGAAWVPAMATNGSE
jgi:hypothetical protein